MNVAQLGELAALQHAVEAARVEDSKAALALGEAETARHRFVKDVAGDPDTDGESLRQLFARAVRAQHYSAAVGIAQVAGTTSNSHHRAGWKTLEDMAHYLDAIWGED